MKSTIVSFSRLPGVVVSVGVVLAVALQASAGVYDPPQPTDISGTTASGLQWSAVATGTALPIRTSATSSFNGQPGAVAYFNTLTGQLQVNPRGYDPVVFGTKFAPEKPANPGRVGGVAP